MPASPANSPSETASNPATPVEAPPLAPGAAPLCYVVDEEPSIRHFLALVLHGSGIDTVEFADGAALRRSTGKREPDLIFHNIALNSADAIESMVALGKRGFKGAVQLTSSRGAAVLEHVKNVGVERKLTMLPVLKKPYETEAIVKIIQELKLGMSAATARIELAQALANKWIEFWYQPKIDLRKKQLAGAEAYARARHPQHGLLLPSAFMPDAPEASAIKLSELALGSALKTGVIFSKLGVNIPLTVNIQPAVLVKLPIADIVKAHRPGADKWPGLIVDLREEDIVSDLALARDIAQRLAPHNVRLAIDELGAQLFGAGAVRRNALCRAQARSQIHRRLRHRQGQHAAVQIGDRPRPQAPAQRGRHGHRKGRRRHGAGQPGLRLRPGLPARPADAGGAIHRAVAPALGGAGTRTGGGALGPRGREPSDESAQCQWVQASRRLNEKLSE